MKSPIVWLLAAALAAGVFIAVAFNAGDGPEKQVTAHASALPTQERGSASGSEAAGKATTPGPAAFPEPAPKLAPDNAPREVILEAINDVAITYDPAELPKIKPYLVHADAEVRRAALDGIVVLGDAAGAPLLRDAARQVASSKEAVEMMQAAEFLELPSATGQIKDSPLKLKAGAPKRERHR